MDKEIQERRIREESFVTKEQLLEKEIAINREIRDAYEKNAHKIGVVDDKVDDLRSLVLPLLESSKATATNTEKIAASLDKFIDKQSDTNGDLYSRISKHDVELAERKGKLESISKSGDVERLEEKKMKNSTKGIIIGGIVSIIIALVGVAPAIASLIFK